jgi:hypothetical protein
MRMTDEMLDSFVRGGLMAWDGGGDGGGEDDGGRGGSKERAQGVTPVLLSL